MGLSSEILIDETALRRRVQKMAATIAADTPGDRPLSGSDLLVVEDILEKGKTLAALRQRLVAMQPARLRIAVLLDKPARRSEQVEVGFSGFTVDDRWVVGYGLDW